MAKKGKGDLAVPPVSSSCVAYDLFEHRHRFSVWAAARAVNSRWTSVDVLRYGIESSGIVEFVKTQSGSAITDKEFEVLHRTWCRAIVHSLQQRGVQNVTFGRTAKLVAIYLKSMVIFGTNPSPSLVHVIYPPIDSIMLDNMAKCAEFCAVRKAVSKSLAWSKLDETTYYNLISTLRGLMPFEEPFWMLERLWTVTKVSVASIGDSE